MRTVYRNALTKTVEGGRGFTPDLKDGVPAAQHLMAMKPGGGKAPIKIKAANAGKLRAAAGVKKGRTIPAAKLAALAKSKNPKTRQRAVFAQNARNWAKKGSK